MDLNFSDLMRSLLVTLIAFSYLTTSAWSAEGTPSTTTQSSKEESEKKKEKPEFEITCSDEEYLAIINYSIDKLKISRRNKLSMKNRYDREISEGLNPGKKDLPNLPSNKFQAPEDLSATVFRHKAGAFLKARNDYLLSVEGRTVARVLQFYEDLEIVMKNLVLSANEQCKKLEDRRAAAKERGAGVVRGTTYASSSENHALK